MSTRNINDAKDLKTNEPIYFKSHEKATYMSNCSTVGDVVGNFSKDVKDKLYRSININLKTKKL